MFPFDLERALAGEELVTWNGRPAKGFRERNLSECAGGPAASALGYSALVWVGAHAPDCWEKETFTGEGKFLRKGSSVLDLFMRCPPPPPAPHPEFPVGIFLDDLSELDF